MIVWVGISIWSVVVVVFLAGLFPIVVNLAKRRPERGSRPAASRPQLRGRPATPHHLTVVVPSSVPFFLAGLRLAVIGSLVSIVVGEMYASRAGIGYLVGGDWRDAQVDRMFAAVLCLTVSGLFALWAIDRAQRRVERWRPARAA